VATVDARGVAPTEAVVGPEAEEPEPEAVPEAVEAPVPATTCPEFAKPVADEQTGGVDVMTLT
jgi:hypothetical protein